MIKLNLLYTTIRSYAKIYPSIIFLHFLKQINCFYIIQGKYKSEIFNAKNSQHIKTCGGFLKSIDPPKIQLEDIG